MVQHLNYNLERGNLTLNVSFFGEYMNEDNQMENSSQLHDVGSTSGSIELEQIAQQTDAIVSELRRLQFKVTLVMGLLVLILFGIWK